MNQIRSAEIKDRGSIVCILNKVTLYLHENGINQWCYPWNYYEIEKDIKSGHVYVMTENDLIIGTFSMKDIDNLASLLIEHGSKYLYRVALLPEHQGENLGIKVINYACEYAGSLEKALYLDCWAGNEKLRSFYRSAGFVFLGDFPEEDYFISVFKFYN